MPRGRLVWWSYGVVASFAFILNGFGPVLDDLREELGLSRTMAGLHGSALALGNLVAGTIGERLRVRFGWADVFRGACLGVLAGVLALALAPGPALSLPAAVVIGTGGALLLIMAPAVLRAARGEAAGENVAEAHATASLTSILAPLAVGLSLAAFGSWLPALLLIVAGVLPLLIVVAPPLPDSPAAPAGPSGRLPRAYWPWWAALFCCVAAEFAILLWAADDARVRLGLGTEAAALAPTAFLLGMGLVRAFGARLLPIRRAVSLYRAGCLVAILGFLAYHVTSVPAVALPGVAVVGLGIGLLFPVSLTAMMSSAPGAESLASARSALAGGLAIGTGPLALGALADATSIGTAAWIVPGILAAGLVTTVRR